jgi:hypothetical protein
MEDQKKQKEGKKKKTITRKRDPAFTRVLEDSYSECSEIIERRGCIKGRKL